MITHIQGLEMKHALRILIFTTSEVEREAEAESRIKAFASSITSDNSLNLVLLVDDQNEQGIGLHAFLVLQDMLFDMKRCALLLATAPDQVLPLVEKHIDQIANQPPALTPLPCLPTTLVAHSTVNGPTRPLSEHDANVVTDLFGSIRDLEEGTRTAEGVAKLREYLGVQKTKDLVDFWEDEWLA